MNCDDVRQHFADHWSGNLAGEARREFDDHLAGCAACREQAERLSFLWDRLGSLPAERPGPELRERFYTMLEAYRVGLGDAPRRRLAAAEWLRQLWPRRPAFQAMVALATLVAGVGIGYMIAAGRRQEPEISQLRAEVNNMRQLVALSLLQQQSASERLKGVTWAYRVDESDTQVLGALMKTLNQDPNDNVRLAAVDALKNFADTPAVKNGLGPSIAQQTSPLVQIALIDLAADLRERQASDALRKIAGDAGASPEVRERARWALGRIAQ